MVGLALSVVYVSVYFYYVSPAEKGAEYRKLFGVIAFITIIMLYSKVSGSIIALMHVMTCHFQFEDPSKIEERFGLIFTGLFFGFMVLPILDSIKVVKEKTTRHLPFPMIATGFLVGLSWFLHGIIIQSGFVIVIKLINLH